MKDSIFRQFPKFQLNSVERSRAAIEEIYSVYGRKGSIAHSMEELQVFYELALGVHNPPGTPGYVLQCGIFQGGSLCVFGLGLRDSGAEYSPAVGIDPYRFYGDDSEWTAKCNVASEVLRKNIFALEVNTYVCPVIYNDLGFLERFWHDPIRVGFIDTNHTYNQTKDEARLLLPHMVDKGWLVFHDYRDDGDFWLDQTVPAINEVLDSVDTYQVLHVPHTLFLQIKK